MMKGNQESVIVENRYRTAVITFYRSSLDGITSCVFPYGQKSKDKGIYR